jgi:hypothetical protein
MEPICAGIEETRRKIMRTVSKAHHVAKGGHPNDWDPAADVHVALADHLARPLSSKQRDAHRRLLQTYMMPYPETMEDITGPIFEDLDVLLFGASLWRKVKVRWVDNIGRADTVAETSNSIILEALGKAITITLDRGKLAYTPWRFGNPARRLLWGTLVHEMLHAYLDCKTSWKWWKRLEKCGCGAEVVSRFRHTSGLSV